MGKIIDITVPIIPGLLTWPGDPPISIEPTSRIADGAICNMSRISFGSHAGTHVDPPLHFIDKAQSVDELPLDALIGPAWVAHFPDKQAVGSADLEAAGIPQVERLILKTDNSKFWPPNDGVFREDFVYLAPDGAEWVVKRGIRLVGTDFLSIQQYKAPTNATHLALLGNGVVVVEGLDLTQVEPGAYELICLPLKVAGGDGAPMRAVLVR